MLTLPYSSARLCTSLMAAMALGMASCAAGTSGAQKEKPALRPPAQSRTRGHAKGPTFPEALREPGLFIPSPAARQLVLVFISRDETQILDVRRQDGTRAPGALLSAGPVTLDGGLVLDRTCGEHLRIGDTIRNGVVRNASDRPVRVLLSSGQTVTVAPGRALYVGPYQVYRPGGARSPQAASSVTHTLQCECTCSTGTTSTTITFACGAACVPEGNQCRGSDGTECVFDPDGDGPTDPVTGTTSDCHEILVPAGLE